MNAESLNLSTSNGATTAYVARPHDDVSACVLLIQEWWGINDHIRAAAKQLAELGYIAFAPDIYGRGIRPATPQEAGKLVTFGIRPAGVGLPVAGSTITSLPSTL